MMPRATWHEKADLAARILVAATWAVAGGLKLSDPAGFTRDIENYRLVSGVWAGAAAVYLPWLELALAAGLLVPRAREAARVLSVGLLVVFCAALAGALARGLDIRCGCFGGAGAGVTIGWALVRNAVLATALLCFRSGTSGGTRGGGPGQ